MVPVPPGGVYGELTNAAGVRGKNSPTPSQKLFGRHFFLRYKSTYYDASYGVTYTGAKNFEQKALDGYGDFVPGSGGRKVDIVKVPAAGAAAKVEFDEF